jgi:hypothetical protein
VNRESVGTWVGAIAGILGVVVAVIFGVLQLHQGGSSRSSTTLPTITTPAPAHSPDVGLTASTSPAESSAEPSESAAPAPVPAPTMEAARGWPTDADDGEPAMHAYFGSEFFLPDWVSCEQTYCIAGGGDKIYVFKTHPIERVDSFGAHVSDPYGTLVVHGFSPQQARALLKETA